MEFMLQFRDELDLEENPSLLMSRWQGLCFEVVQGHVKPLWMPVCTLRDKPMASELVMWASCPLGMSELSRSIPVVPTCASIGFEHQSKTLERLTWVCRLPLPPSPKKEEWIDARENWYDDDNDVPRTSACPQCQCPIVAPLQFPRNQTLASVYYPWLIREPLEWRLDAQTPTRATKLIEILEAFFDLLDESQQLSAPSDDMKMSLAEYHSFILNAFHRFKF